MSHVEALQRLGWRLNNFRHHYPTLFPPQVDTTRTNAKVGRVRGSWDGTEGLEVGWPSCFGRNLLATGKGGYEI
jgi:hypothetical protein